MSSPVAPHSAAFAGFELSSAQVRVWRWQGAGASAVHAPAELELELPEDVDVARLRASLGNVCARHEVLRTRYQRQQELTLPLQVIAAEASVAWNVPDPGSAHLSATLSACGARQRLVLRLPALALDSESLARLAGEWVAHYCGARPAQEPLQFADYAAWRAELSAGDENARSFWARQLARRAIAAALPLRQRASSRARGPALQVSELPLPAELVARCEQVARERGTKPALLVLAAWLTLLHQHGETDQLTLALDWQERSAHWGELLGLLSEPLPLVLEPLAASSTSALLAQLNMQLGELLELRDHFPSGDELSAPPLGFRYVPLAGASELQAAGFALRGVRSALAPHRLLLELLGSGAGTHLLLHHDPELYSGHAAQLIGDQLVTLLEQVCQQPELPLRELCALSATERRTSLAVLALPDPLPQGRQRIFDEAATAGQLGALFARACREHAALPAVRAGQRSLSYGELDAAASQLAARLRARGAARGSRLVHFLERDSDAIVALLAILKVGAVYVPVDPAYPSERVAFILRDAGVELIVTRTALCPRLPGSWRERARLVLLDGDGADAPAGVAASSAHTAAESNAGWSDAGPSDLAYIIYTSGSTGEPRGVPITHENALWSLAARLAYYPEACTGFMLLSSFAFDSSIAGLFGTLAQGGCLHLCSEEEQKDPERLGLALAQHPVTQLLALPSLYQLLLPVLARRGCRLRAAIVAGEACPRALVALHQQLLPAVALYNEYGATEASVWSTVARCESEHPHRPVSIGRPIPGSRVYVLDERGEPSARGLAGELVVAGKGLSPGYLNRPELTQQKFIERDGQRLYRSGDLAYWDERGEIVFIGRADGQVKIRGHRIELGEVEAALTRVSGAEQVVVLLARGEDEQPYLRAFLGRCPELDRAALRAALGQLLPEVMIPGDLLLLPELPRTANGKYDRRALLELRTQRERAEYAAPETALERRLAALWERLLGATCIGRDDDFFALGGHSLLAIRLVYEVRSELGLELPVVQVFQARTLRELAARLLALAASVPAARAQASCLRELLPPDLLSPELAAPAPALFCIDPTGQHVAAYEPLARALAPAVRALGLELGPALLAAAPSVEQVARQLLAELRSQQPSGPYRVLGWSLGGVFALALARELERSGEQVELVAVLDTQPLPLPVAGEEHDWLAELAEHLSPEHRRELWALPAAEQRELRTNLAALPDAARIDAAIRLAQGRGWLAGDAPPEAFRERYALLRAAARFVRALADAPLRAPVLAAWSEESLSRHRGPPVDWQEITRGQVLTLTVAGDHEAVVQAADVASALRGVLACAAEVSA